MTVKITAFAELLPAAAAAGDLFEVVDVSDTSGAPTGTNKKFQLGSIGTYLQNANAFVQKGASSANNRVVYYENEADGKITGAAFEIGNVARKDVAQTFIDDQTLQGIPDGVARLYIYSQLNADPLNRRKWLLTSGTNRFRITPRLDDNSADGDTPFTIHHPGGVPAQGGVTCGINATVPGTGALAADALYEYDGGANTRVPGLKRSETWSKGHQASNWVSVATTGAYTFDPANGNYFLFTAATGTLTPDITGTGFSSVFRIANSAVVLNTANFNLVLPASLPTGNNRVGSAHIDDTGFKTLVLWGSA